MAAARESFEFVTGLPTGTQLAPLQGKPPRAQPLEEYLAAIDKRPDLRSFSARTEAVQEQVTIAKGAHAPTAWAQEAVTLVHGPRAPHRYGAMPTPPIRLQLFSCRAVMAGHDSPAGLGSTREAYGRGRKSAS